MLNEGDLNVAQFSAGCAPLPLPEKAMQKEQEQPNAKTIAHALGITFQAVQKRAGKEGWAYTEETIRGGRRRLYDIRDLPADIQAALAQTLLADRGSMSAAAAEQIGNQEAHAASELATLGAHYESKPAHGKEEAQRRLAIVQAYAQLRGNGIARPAVIDAVAIQHHVSHATLQRYLALVDGRPEHAWLYLLTPRHFGRTAKAAFSPEAWEILKADYLRPERPAAAACIARLREMSRARDWHLPATRTMQRRLERIERVVKVLAREGAKAVKRLYPAQQRAKAALHALAIVNADGYKHNVWVRFPDGEIVRAKTWFWQDVYSSKVLAWRTDKTEHTDMIRLSFGDLVEQWGIPEAALLDNTLAAANKTMSGGVRHRFRFKVREEEPDGVFKNLGVDLHWATPEHGQAKPVERTFGVGGVGEYIDKAPEFAGAWTGGNVLDKPDYDGKTRAVELAELQAVIAREIAAWNAREGRRGAMTSGRSIDAVFDESYKATPIRRATETQARLWLLATEPVRAARDGSITLDAGRIVGERLSNRYWSPDLSDYAGRLVAARFDPQRLHEGVHVYTADGRYLCFAECDRPAGFNDQLAGRERNRARNIFIRNAKAMRAAECRMDVLDVVKARAGTDAPVIPAPAAPARNVIRGEFRDPLERPRLVASAATP